MVRCAKRPESRPIMRRTVRYWKRWRVSYRGHWRLESERLPGWVHGTLARLRGCETRGIPYPANYRWNGHHHGAFQYLGSTWARAQVWVGVPTRYRRWPAYRASKDHQDAVTGRFFFAHRNEWACRA